jgi:tripartite ATP-independent transporter DctP family solute receptor
MQTSRFFPIFVIFLCQFLFFGHCLAARKIILQSSDVHGEGYPTVEAVKYMGELLSMWTNGRIVLKLYTAAKLGGERDAVEQVRSSYMDITRVSVGLVGKYAEGLNAFNLPYVFRSVEHMHSVVDGQIGEELLLELQKGGLIGLCFMDAGARSFYNKIRVINSPADMKGLKFRVMDNPIFVEMANALGADAITIPFPKIYSAIEKGGVDGAENNPPTVYTQKHFKVTKYYSLTEHLIIPEILVFSLKAWNGLEEIDKILIRKAAAACVEKERELWREQEQEYFKKLHEIGYAINKISDKKPFIEATKAVRDKFGQKYTALIKRIEETR